MEHRDQSWCSAVYRQRPAAAPPNQRTPPWRFTASDYREAARQEVASLRLAGIPADAPWDSDLVPAMRHEGYAVEEEAVADLLANDILARSRRGGKKSGEGADHKGCGEAAGPCDGEAD